MSAASLSPRAIVVGGGLVGTLMAIYLGRRGWPVTIYERHSDPRAVSEDTQGASINLTLCVRGLRALERGAALGSIQPALTPVYGRLVHGEDGALTYQAYGDAGEAIYSIKRRALNGVLLDIAEQVGTRIQFSYSCVDIDPSTRQLTIRDTDGRTQTCSASCVVVADGASSRIRSTLRERGYLRESVQPSAAGYKTLEIASEDCSGLRAGAIHVWPRKRCLALAFPNRDGSYSVAIHAPVDGSGSFTELGDHDRMHAFLAGAFPDLPVSLHDCASRLVKQRHRPMRTVQCEPWSVGGWAVLMGDASHAIVPHFGQGANAGFEDCRLLDELIDAHSGDWSAACASFERVRRPDIAAVADLCCEHQNNLHYAVDTRDYQERLALERRLHQLCPTRVLPLYSMLSFSEMPYSEAQTRDRIQRHLITDLLARGRLDAMLEEQAFVQSIRYQIERDLPAIK